MKRAMFFGHGRLFGLHLDATRGLERLGIEDADIEELVDDPTLRGEIDALRRLECQ